MLVFCPLADKEPESDIACGTVLRAEPFCARNRSEFDIVIVTTVPACSSAFDIVILTTVPACSVRTVGKSRCRYYSSCL